MSATAYASQVSTRVTPQSEPIPGKIMVPNSAGGHAFPVDDWTRLERFLILGNEGGSYYASERAMTVENAQCVLRCAAADADRTIKTIRDVSANGRAPKNDPAIFALAMVAGQKGNVGAKALAVLSDVCRTGTHLFQFIACAKQFRGWGRSMKRAVGNWYLNQEPRDLAYQVTKYQQRDSWSHRDVLRLSKPIATGPISTVLRWAVGKDVASNELPVPIAAFEAAKRTTDKSEIVRLISDSDLVRECVPTQFLNEPEVWEALLQKMPMTAMVRNLGKMSEVGLLKPMSSACKMVCERLRDATRIHKSRLHPLAILIAQRIYGQGRGMRGSLTWNADSSIIDALDEAFTLAFDAVVPAGKRFLLGLDVSGSMGSGQVAGSPITPREASAAMALVTMRTEQQTHCIGFTGRGFSVNRQPVRSGAWSMWGNHGSGVEALNITAKMRLNDAVRAISNLPMGPTDCALPMLYALENKIEADVFVIYTDSETWHGAIHPVQALQQYRERTGIPAKLIVVGMVANQFSIADPNDAGMLDVVGFDTSAPSVMADFAR